MLLISIIINNNGEIIMTQKDTTIKQAIEQYLDYVKLARSYNTFRTYTNAMNFFDQTLRVNNLPSKSRFPEDLPEDAITWFASDLKQYSPATERLYLTAVKGFYEFLMAERLASPNLPRVNMLIRQRSRKPGQRLPQFPKKDIEYIIQYAINLASSASKDRSEMLRNLRDRAFLLTLADTGMRVHEACNLRRGDIDWNEGKAIIIGKGNWQAVIRFSLRSMKALKDYLSLRRGLDGASGKPLASLPLFARHDLGAGKNVKPITTATGRNICSQRVEEALGKESVGSITPHSFRHYFVTTVLQASGNLKLAQELARHQNISVTQRYAHLSDDELDRGYWEIFEDNNNQSR
jgi:integrase/recombinase XerC